MMIKHPLPFYNTYVCMCEGVEGTKGLCLDREAPESVSAFVYSCGTFNPLGAVCLKDVEIGLHGERELCKRN